MKIESYQRAYKQQVTAFILGIQQGVTDIYLGIIDVYQAAMRFYEKNGYQKLERRNLPSTFPLIVVDNVFYYKQL